MALSRFRHKFRKLLADAGAQVLGDSETGTDGSLACLYPDALLVSGWASGRLAQRMYTAAR